MSNRTQTVKNGHGEHGPRDVIWGREVKKTLAGGVISVISVVLTIIGAAWYLSGRITAAENKPLSDSEKLAIANAVAVQINDNDAAKSYISEKRLREILAAELAPLKADIGLANTRLGRLESGDRYNRRVLSTIDLTPPKPKEE